MTQREPSPPPRASNRTGALFALLFCLGSGSYALWIAITGPTVTGGVPFVPYEVNQVIGRVVFGVSGLICFGIARLAARDVWGRPR